MWSTKNIKTKSAEFKADFKHFDECSCFGINEGRISKLMIVKNGKVVCNYDRGWDVEPTDKETLKVYEEILKEFN